MGLGYSNSDIKNRLILKKSMWENYFYQGDNSPLENVETGPCVISCNLNTIHLPNSLIETCHLQKSFNFFNAHRGCCLKAMWIFSTFNLKGFFFLSFSCILKRFRVIFLVYIWHFQIFYFPEMVYYLSILGTFFKSSSFFFKNRSFSDKFDLFLGFRKSLI